MRAVVVQWMDGLVSEEEKTMLSREIKPVIGKVKKLGRK